MTNKDFTDLIKNGKFETMIVNSLMGMDLIVFATRKLLNNLRNKDKRLLSQIEKGCGLTDRIFIVWEYTLNEKEKIEIKSYLRGRILGEMSLEDNLENFDRMFRGMFRGIK